LPLIALTAKSAQNLTSEIAKLERTIEQFEQDISAVAGCRTVTPPASDPSWIAPTALAWPSLPERCR